MRPVRFLVRSIGLALALASIASCGGGGGDSSAASRQVPAEIQKIFDKPAYRDALWSLRVVDVESGLVVYDMNSARQMLIGSVRKLFSVALALEALGPEHALRTPVHRRGKLDSAGVLSGDLIVVASGDIAMGGRTRPDGSFAISTLDHNEANSLGGAVLTTPDPLAGFDALAAQVAASGIRHVTGDVIIDDRLFEAFDFRNEFKVGPMFVNDDVVDAIIDRKGSALTVDWRPKSAAFAVQSDLKLGAAGSGAAIELAPELPTCIGVASCTGRVSGTLPPDFVPPLTGTYPLIRTFRIVEPSNYARTVFIEALARAGVSVSASPVAPNSRQALPQSSAYLDENRVAELVSHPYKDHARYICKVSYNIGADASLMLFGVSKGTRNIEGAKAAELQMLATQYGISQESVHFVDGSGGGDTAATGEAVTRLLEQVRKRPTYAAFRDAQPLLGIDGSLSFVTDFQRDPILAGATGKVHGKTGTYVTAGPDGGAVLKAQALAGYIDARSGRQYVFSLVVNDAGKISGVDQILPVIQDEGTIAALLWKLL